MRPIILCRRFAGAAIEHCRISDAQLAPFPALRGLAFMVGGILSASLAGIFFLPAWVSIVVGASWLAAGSLVFPWSRSIIVWFTLGVALTSLQLKAPWANYKRLLPGDESYIEAEVVVTDMMVTGSAGLAWLAPKGKAEVELTRIRFHKEDAWKPCSGKLLLYDKNSVFEYGQTLSVCGALRKPFSSTLPHQFNQARYLKLKGIDHCLTATEIEIISSVHGWRRGPRALLSVRSKLLSALLDGMASEDNQAVLAAIMFGLKSGMDIGQKNLFRNSGMLHLFAVSGLHVGIIFSLLILVMNLSRVPFRWRYALAPGILLVYICLTGAESSAVRAWVMLSVWSISKSLYLPGKALNTVMVAALVLLLFNPLNLLQAGFQYSFLLVAAILCGWRIITLVWNCYSMPLKLIPGRSQGSIRWKYRVRQVIFTTFAAMGIFWLGGFGLTAWYSHLVLPMSICSNMFVGFVAWGIMALGWLKIAVTVLYIPILPEAMNAGLESLMVILRFLAGAVSSEAWVYGIGTVPLILILAYYAGFFLFVASPCNFRSISRRGIALGCLILLTVFWQSPKPDRTRVDVFLPNSSTMPVVCIREGSRTMLVNCGPKGFRYTLSNWLRGEGIRTIDKLVVLDGTVQSCGGLAELGEAVQIGAVYQLAGREMTRHRRPGITPFRHIANAGCNGLSHKLTYGERRTVQHLAFESVSSRSVYLELETAESEWPLLRVGERTYDLTHSNEDIMLDSFTVN